MWGPRILYLFFPDSEYGPPIWRQGQLHMAENGLKQKQWLMAGIWGSLLWRESLWEKSYSLSDYGSCLKAAHHPLGFLLPHPTCRPSPGFSRLLLSVSQHCCFSPHYCLCHELLPPVHHSAQSFRTQLTEEDLAEKTSLIFQSKPAPHYDLLPCSLVFPHSSWHEF